jgi:hypothetical protein
MFSWHSEVVCRKMTAKRMARMDLIYPVSTEEPTVVGIGCRVTATYVIVLESIDVNMGDPRHDVNGSGSTDEATRPKSPDACSGSQRGHSTRSAGKLRTWGRATP